MPRAVSKSDLKVPDYFLRYRYHTEILLSEKLTPVILTAYTVALVNVILD
jgi:hypothetical protein